jgi:hypothetical protein
MLPTWSQNRVLELLWFDDLLSSPISPENFMNRIQQSRDVLKKVVLIPIG